MGGCSCHTPSHQRLSIFFSNGIVCVFLRAFMRWHGWFSFPSCHGHADDSILTSWECAAQQSDTTANETEYPMHENSVWNNKGKDGAGDDVVHLGQ